ncbi:MAG: nucleotidyltransferase family protein [Pseudomonadota bacterium]|jgi:MurNAc alpha-1-phosphate uridylyltransferase|nr:nucleotidyltransferase family protein [Alphaproteobacteria bacterium]
MMNISSTAMILAAGFGKRLGDITKNTPKPLVSIGDTCCLDISVNALKQAGFKRIIINTHYLAEQIEAYVKCYRDVEIILSHEEVLLETAGGIRKVLEEFGDKPFVVINADMYWQDTNPSVIHRMAKGMREMDDFCLCVTPLENAQGHPGKGDFVFENGQMRKPTESDSVQDRYVYIGVQLVNPRIIAPLKIEPLALPGLYAKALQQQSLKGCIFEGTWIDVGSIEGLTLARNLSA